MQTRGTTFRCAEVPIGNIELAVLSLSFYETGVSRLGKTYLLLILVIFTPSLCFGNYWVSGVTAFRQTPEFFIIFTAIVTIEALVVAVWFRPMKFSAVFWRILLFNIISSLAGDLLFRLDWAPSYGEIWKQAIPFFLLTIATEVPFAKLLFRGILQSWKKAALVVITVNVASYAVLIMLEPPLRKKWMTSLSTKDHQVLSGWTNLPMLADAPGRIYSTAFGRGAMHRLTYFDFTNQKWQTLSNSPSIDPRWWDVEVNLFAFTSYADAETRGLARLTTIPDCEIIRDFPLPGGREARDMAISPDGSKLAVLVYSHDIQGPLGDSSYQVLATSHTLVTFEIASGKMTVAPRMATGGLCWLPDSSTLLFFSLQDESLLDLRKLPKGWKRQYNLKDPNHPFTPVIFQYKLENGAITRFDPLLKPLTPRVAPDANTLAFFGDREQIILLDVVANTPSAITLQPIARYGRLDISPDARFALLPFQLSGINYFGYPTIVSLSDPSKKYYLGPILYRAVWSRTTTVTNSF